MFIQLFQLPNPARLDNPLVNASLPPFAVEAAEACKRQMEAAEVPLDLADNGVDNSDSDSEDLGPETAVDVDDLDNEARNHVEPTTPPAHTGSSPYFAAIQSTVMFQLLKTIIFHVLKKHYV